MSTTYEPVTVPAGPAGEHGADRDPFCQHEFDDVGLCAHDAVPGETRCAGHRDDGQPDHAIGGGR